MTAAVETMAYVGETPWHGLGHKLEKGATVEQMTVAAGLDWKVVRRPLFARIDENTEVQIDGKVAITRETDNSVLSVASDRWQPFQNAELMEFFREYVEAGAATLETAGSLHDGKTIWALANINDGFTLNGNDRVNGYVLLSNSHEPGTAIRVMTTMVRVVCQNTLSMAHNRGLDQYRQSHIKQFNMQAARDSLQFARAQVHQHELEANALNSLKMSAFDTVRTLAKHFQPDMQDDLGVACLLKNPETQNPVMADVLYSVVTAPGAIPDSAWGLLNGVTHYADHVAGKTSANRMVNGTFGRMAKIKQEVRLDLLQLADFQVEKELVAA
jgi:phage/plasmid-like protein (TIGR03299 family)